MTPEQFVKALEKRIDKLKNQIRKRNKDCDERYDIYCEACKVDKFMIDAYEDALVLAKSVVAWKENEGNSLTKEFWKNESIRLNDELEKWKSWKENVVKEKKP